MSEQKIIERLTEELELALAENAKLKRLEGVVIIDRDGNTLDWEIVEGVVEVDAEIRPDWISVEDEMPNERCIAYTPDQDEVGTWRIIPKGLFRQAASEATHWLPMPPSPTEE